MELTKEESKIKVEEFKTLGYEKKGKYNNRPVNRGFDLVGGSLLGNL